MSGHSDPPRRDLAVTADLAISVATPAGRSTTVRVSDADGVVAIDIDDVRVVLAALPRVGMTTFGTVRRALRGSGLPWDSFSQDVVLRVRGREVGRRVAGRWRAGVADRRLLGVAGAVAVVVGGVVAVLLGVRRGLRPR